MTELTVDQLSVYAAGQPLVENASFALRPGELQVIVGPNGAGKSSLLRAGLGLLTATSGSARLNRTDIAAISPLERARQISYLPQIKPLAWPSRVRDIVALGRFCYGASLGKLKPADASAVARALTACDLDALADRPAHTLSGGELARVHFARALAAETPLLVADEPIASLDPSHQFRILDLVSDYVAKGGGAILVLHDLALAARYATHLIWMLDGRIVLEAPPEESLTADAVGRIFGVDAEVTERGLILNGRSQT